MSISIIHEFYTLNISMKICGVKRMYVKGCDGRPATENVAESKLSQRIYNCLFEKLEKQSNIFAV